ncbi:MAG TPA: Ger(x)C family spore germination protein [Clostridia bacterium]|nr:Ger(x)C family spore germination protein [Clostridia bacterium]
MTIRRMRFAALILSILMVSALSAGCWDNDEIDQLFIVTGIALDTVPDSPEQVSITMQVSSTKQEGSDPGSGKQDSGQNSVILLHAVNRTILGGLAQINQNSSHRLLLSHNQIRLYSVDLAQQGIIERMDVLLRDQDARLEVPLAVVDGRAEDMLALEMPSDPTSGIFLGDMFQDMANTSVKYRVRLIDFVGKLLEETTSPVLPLLEVVSREDKQEIKMTGMAVFNGDKMIGRLSNEEALGYIWSLGDVKKNDFQVNEGTNTALLHIIRLDSKREVVLRQDGVVQVTFYVEATLAVSELYGFAKFKPKELMPHLVDLAQKEIEEKIAASFTAARKLNADIFGFGTSVYKKYPKEWKDIKKNWNALFLDIDLHVEAKVQLPGTGQIVQSLEMEKNEP